MAMTKADYESLALLFKGRASQSYIDNGTMAALIADFCNLAKYKNERFNAEKFIKASCTPEVDALIERVVTVMDYYGAPEVNGIHYYPHKEVWNKR